MKKRKMPQHTIKRRLGGNVLSALSAYGIKFVGNPFTKYGLEGVDIDREYELIQQKKSKLSRSERDRVVAIYEGKKRQYNEIRKKASK